MRRPINDVVHDNSRGVWVPAFAGTTIYGKAAAGIAGEQSS